MARYLFGGSPADYVISTNEADDDQKLYYRPLATVTFWDAKVDGTRLTDLRLDFNGSNTDAITATSTGRIPQFYGPDGITQLWADTGDNERYAMVSTDLGAIVDGKISTTEADNFAKVVDVANIQRQLGLTPRVVMFNTETNTWPVQSDVTATNPPIPIFWYGNAALPTQLRRGLDYVDQLTNGSTNVPDEEEPVDEEPVEGEPGRTIAMTTPVASANGANVTLSATITTAGGAQQFAFVQIAVRGPSGQQSDTAFNPNVSVDGALNLNGGFVASASGTWRAYISYNITGGSAQTDWVDGPVRTFTVTIPSGGTPVGGVPLVGRSGKTWNSGVAAWVTTGNGCVALANAFGTWRGRPVDGFLKFADRSSWEGMFNIASEWAAWPGYIVNSMPPQPQSQNNSGTANGSNNSRWEGYGQALTAAGLNRNTYILRVWEVNGYWYNWAWGDERGTKSAPNTPASFVAAMKNLSMSVKKYAPNIKISVNLNRGSGRSNTTWQSVIQQLVGSHQYGKYIDIIGLDSYDWFPGQTNDGNWNNARNQSPGFADIAAFCRSNGLQIGVEEWALISASGGAVGGGGGDNPYFIQRMHQEFDSIKDVLAYEGYYENGGAPAELDHPISTGHYPNAAAAYRANTRWGV